MTLFALDAYFAPPASGPWTEPLLLAVAMHLGARSVRGWTEAEERLVEKLPTPPQALIAHVRARIAQGEDPLGEAFSLLRSPAMRRTSGATYTPLRIVESMVSWALASGPPSRIVDPGVGSGRFLLAAGRKTDDSRLIGIDVDPTAAIVARGNLAAAGLASRAEVVLSDYRLYVPTPIAGRTLFIGNPPYVRHHLIDAVWKDWLVQQAGRFNLSASQLAGLHVHFFLATLLHAQNGDAGSFITAAEWLDVNYGSLVRELLLGRLGGKRIVVIEPTAMPFPDAATTAAITSFAVGEHPKAIRMHRISALDKLPQLDRGRSIIRERLEAEHRWSHLTRPTKAVPSGFIELGEICRVHRGQVTGSNKIWIAGKHSEGLPASVLFPTITKAKELFLAGQILRDSSSLKNVIDLPVDLGVLDPEERRAVERFLQRAKSLGADMSYTARQRKAWWAVGLRQPAPVLATYMARRPPAFVRNLADARHINIAHGLYPREHFSDAVLQSLVAYLAKSASLNDGRTYAGGLTKFEPREMERILVPSPQLLETEYRC